MKDSYPFVPFETPNTKSIVNRFSPLTNIPMENASPDPIIVLNVKNMCCGSYQKKLEKELLKLDGVNSISIDSENRHVSVRGRVDSNLLLKTIAKTGKYAELVNFNRNSTDREFKPNRNVTGKCPHDTRNRAQQYGDSRDNGHRFEEEEEEHKCENYEPLDIEELICRDYWCKEHKQRPIFHDKVPASASTGIFGYPFHNSGAPFHFPNNPWQPYGYHRRPPPPPYGLFSGGYMAGSRAYDYGFLR